MNSSHITAEWLELVKGLERMAPKKDPPITQQLIATLLTNKNSDESIKRALLGSLNAGNEETVQMIKAVKDAAPDRVRVFDRIIAELLGDGHITYLAITATKKDPNSTKESSFAITDKGRAYIQEVAPKRFNFFTPPTIRSNFSFDN